MCVLGQPELVGSVLTFPSGNDTLEYSCVKATAVSVHLRILFVTLENTNSDSTIVRLGATGYLTWHGSVPCTGWTCHIPMCCVTSHVALKLVGIEGNSLSST